jgi:ABC-2 type transport system ATP-binding protein
LSTIPKRGQESTGTETIVRVSGMGKSYGRLTAVRDVAFTIRAREILGVIGPNGAGKTTLLECLAGVQPADSGEVTFGNSLSNGNRSSILFYVPDGIAPWPNQSVQWSIDFTLGFFGGRRDFYPEVARDLDLEPLLRKTVVALSKGQRKRLLLAIALLAPQPVILIDEPFEGLDLRQSREVEATLRKQVSAGRTLVLSIHQIADAARICNRFVLLNSGKLVAEGTLEELFQAASSRLGHAPARDFEEIFLALT